MAGVYISYPFCRQKCTYCNFASGVGRAAEEREYFEALLAEVAAHRWEWTPETVYLGGGSPDRLDPADLERLLALVPGRPWREATIEAAPDDVSPDKAAEWARSGITRVSLGVQSFVEAEIRRTGRQHTAAGVAEAVWILRQAGIGRINIDLIAGLPGQTAESWEESLEWIARLAPGHVSVYMLEIDGKSRLGRELLAGGSRYGAAEVPDEETVALLYERAVAALAEMGLRRYEISNFARPGEESLHNLKYWRLEPYVGFGADAHSYDGRSRRRNAETAREYVDRFRRGRPPAVETSEAASDERFFLGLRLAEGIRLDAGGRRLHAAAIERFLRAGLLEESGGRLRLTDRGVLLSNEVFQEFLAV